MYIKNYSQCWFKSALVAIALLQSGCAALLDPVLKLDAPNRWRNTIASKATNDSAESKPQKLWWLSLNDSILNETVDLALKQNLSLAQANERLSAANAIEKAKKANHYPQVSFIAGPDNLARPLPESLVGEKGNLRTTGAYLTGFDLIWEIPVFGRAESQRKIARANIKTAETDIATAKISISAEVVQAFGELRVAQERLNSYSLMLEKYQLLETLTQQGQKVGLLADSDQEVVQHAMIEMLDSQLIATTQKESALQRLDVLCGLSSPQRNWLDLESVPWTLAHNLNPSPAIPAKLIQQRTDVQHAEAAVLMAAGEAGIARADVYPKLSIEGALMVAGNLAGSSSLQAITLLAPSIRIPILDWGLARQVVNARDAKLREAVLAYRETVLLAVEDVENALANFNAADQRLIRNEKSMDSSHDKSTKIHSAFKAGFLSRPELLKLEIKSQEQTLQLADTKVAWLIAYAQVNKALSAMDTELSENSKPTQQN